jgi:hypothetical protein
MSTRPSIPIQAERLSHSTMDILRTCERKFQIERLMSVRKDDPTAHTVFGQAYGVAIASYLIHKDADKAIYELWMAYYPVIEYDKKSLASCIQLFLCSVQMLNNILQEYEVVSFNGKPAAELSFCLFSDKDYYYVGYMDIVLKNVLTGKYLVLDAKTTGLKLKELDPLYKNSGQLIGYSIVLDAIVGEEVAEYDVAYLVGQMTDTFMPEVKLLRYSKSLLDRLNWFISLGLDIERLERMKELNVYPMRGGSCLQFNRACRHFGTCQLHSQDVHKPLVEDIIEYDFYFNLQELIDNHVQRIKLL